MITANEHLLDFPVMVFIVSLVLLWLSAQAGAYMIRRRGKMEEDERADLGIVVGAALTLLGLIIGFTFSMAITRYDQRKDYEEEEANAIGTEYVRAGLLPAADAAKVHGLLKQYLTQRILFYTTRDPRKLEQINAATTQLQNDLWLAIEAPAKADPSAVSAVVVWGMNDVLNRQGYTQASWWNRIPIAAWALMAAIAVCCSYLVGYNARMSGGVRRFWVLPLIVAISFFLVADIDSPRSGVIRVRPQNLEAVVSSIQAP